MILGVFGTGLIGASIGLRARRDGATVLGFDRDERALERALQVGAIDEAVGRDALYERCGVVAIAAYAGVAAEELKRLRDAPPQRPELIVDVASVKLPIVAAARGLDRFVATHPIAGSERSGAEHARADLFEGRVWAYVPSGSTALDERARGLIAGMGAQPVAVEAERHDAIVAVTSHLPQVLAWAYAAGAAGRDEPAFGPLCGAPGRELLRAGSSGFGMWRDVLRHNAAGVEPPLRALGTRLLQAADALARGDADALRLIFEVGA